MTGTYQLLGDVGQAGAAKVRGVITPSSTYEKVYNAVSKVKNSLTSKSSSRARAPVIVKAVSGGGSYARAPYASKTYTAKNSVTSKVKSAVKKSVKSNVRTISKVRGVVKKAASSVLSKVRSWF